MPLLVTAVNSTAVGRLYVRVCVCVCVCVWTINSQPRRLLSAHVDRRGVDISITVCLFVCTVTDFSAEDKASGVKF